MTQETPCVLIYNPISGHGHLDSWNAIFIGLLLERGFRVLALTPDRKALESRLTKRAHSNLYILAWNFSEPWRMKFRRIWRWWLSYGHIYASGESRIHACMPLQTRAKKRIFQLIVPPLFLVSLALQSATRQLTGRKRRTDDVRDHETHHLDPGEMGRRINAALRKSPWYPDCMFNMYLDMYKTDLTSWDEYARTCGIPWAGIRFVPSNTPPQEGYYALPSLRGMCFLDESVCQRYAACLSGKYFQYLPDATDAELPEDRCSLAEEIQRRAKGRKIVFLGGSIGGQKNISRWCELIQRADSGKWFFIQVGELHSSTFSAEDAEAYQRLVDSRRENVIMHTDYLPDEREFNAVIQAADVIFAAYRDFRISSNMLGKAAHFEKPILVSTGYLMERLVRKYQIGIAVSEHDCAAMLEALDQLASGQIPAVNYERYRKDFHGRFLADNLSAFLQNISQPVGRPRAQGRMSAFRKDKEACS